MKMIKKLTINKIVVASVSLFLLIMFYLIPTTPNINTEVVEENKDLKENIVYLLDNDNYVSRVVTYYDKLDIVDNTHHKSDVMLLIKTLDSKIRKWLIKRMKNENNNNYDYDIEYITKLKLDSISDEIKEEMK